MKHAARVLTGALLLLMAGASLAQPGGKGKRGQGGFGGYADPSGVIAGEIALGQLSVAKGQWVALAKMGAKDAILFTPAPVFAQQWLPRQKGAPLSIKWGTETVYMSCDGRAAVALGHYSQSDGKTGAYTTIWRRDPKAGYRWALNLRQEGSAAAVDPDAGIEISAKVAFCKKRPPRPDATKDQAPEETRPVLDPRQSAPASWDDRSEDGSLRWRWQAVANGTPALTVWMATDGGETQVVGAPMPASASAP